MLRWKQFRFAFVAMASVVVFSCGGLSDSLTTLAPDPEGKADKYISDLVSISPQGRENGFICDAVCDVSVVVLVGDAEWTLPDPADQIELSKVLQLQIKPHDAEWSDGAIYDESVSTGPFEAKMLEPGRYDVAVIGNRNWPESLSTIEVGFEISTNRPDLIIDPIENVTVNAGEIATVEVNVEALDQAVLTFDVEGPAEQNDYSFEAGETPGAGVFVWKTSPSIGGEFTFTLLVTDGENVAKLDLIAVVNACLCKWVNGSNKCYFDGGDCNDAGCWEAEGGCKYVNGSPKCWKAGGGCNDAGCWEAEGGCKYVNGSPKCWAAGESECASSNDSHCDSGVPSAPVPPVDGSSQCSTS